MRGSWWVNGSRGYALLYNSASVLNVRPVDARRAICQSRQAYFECIRILYTPKSISVNQSSSHPSIPSPFVSTIPHTNNTLVRLKCITRPLHPRVSRVVSKFLSYIMVLVHVPVVESRW